MEDPDRAIAFYRDRLGVPHLFSAPPQMSFFLGRRLLEHALTLARQLGFDIVVLQTASVLEKARALYLSAGFAPYEPDSRVPRCDLALRLLLSGAPRAPTHSPRREVEGA